MVWTYERVQVQTKMKYTSFVFRFYQRALHSYYCFSSLHGYIYKIKLYICLKITHDIGVCGH